MDEDGIYRVVPDDGPWGEYSLILIHGIASWYQRGFSGELLVERTGPFVPPMTFPSRLGPVVTDELKRELENSGLAGFSFLPVIKAHVARSRWHEWDIEAPEPARRPRSGKPEDYIAGRTHSEETSERIGDLWELRVEPVEGADFLRCPPAIDLYVTRRAREFLEPRCGRWVRFEKAERQ